MARNGEVLHLEPNESFEYVPVPVTTEERTNQTEPFSKDKGNKAKMKKQLAVVAKADRKLVLTDSNLQRHNLHSTASVVTFNDVPTGLMKEVNVFVDPFSRNYGRRATECERLFGIIPGSFGSPSQDSGSSVEDSRIMVQGLLPNGEAIKAGVKIGKH